MNGSRCWAVVPAAGSGSRFGAATPKQYVMLAGKAVIEHSLAALCRSQCINAVVVAVAANDTTFATLPISREAKVQCCTGGADRARSVLAALKVLDGQAASDDWILVHDAARPLLTTADIQQLYQALQQQSCGGLWAQPVADTLKQVQAGCVTATLDRNSIWRAQTPQLFRFGLLRKALQQALAQGLAISDEASALEAAGYQPVVVPGPAANIKITWPEDITLAEFYLRQQKVTG